MQQYKDPKETKPKQVVESADQGEVIELKANLVRLYKRVQELETRIARMEDAQKSQRDAIRTMSKRTR